MNKSSYTAVGPMRANFCSADRHRREGFHPYRLRRLRWRLFWSC